MTAEKPTSVAGLSAVPELPVVGWAIPNYALFVSDAAKRLGQSPGCDVPLTPHAPAQATIAAQGAEIERLKRERDEARHEIQAVSHRWSWDAESTGARIIDLEKERDALKAKQVADVEETMRLAEAMASAAVADVVDDPKIAHEPAAREALRAHLTKDRT